MNKNIITVGRNIKRKSLTRVAAMALAGTMLFFSGTVMSAGAFSLDKPTFSYSDFSGYTGTKIFINGRFVEFNNQTGFPISVGNTTYVPISVFANVFNAYVHCSESGRVFISKHGAELRMNVNNSDKIFTPDLNNPMKDKVRTTTENRPFVYNGTTYVPLREVFESYGAKVIWNGKSNSICIVSDFEKNSQNIDFKDEKVLEIKDVDLSKKYSKIIYDGQMVDSDYLKILLNADEYKVIEQKETLYVFSHQYLMDVNYIYGAHIARKNNLTNDDTAYKLWSIGEDEITFARELFFRDGYQSFSSDIHLDMVMSGYVYSLMSQGNAKEYEEVDKVVDGIISRVKSSTDNPRKMVELVNNELCDLIHWHSDMSEGFNDSVYSAIVDRDTMCGGFAHAFKYVMDKLGVPCINVSGWRKGGGLPHAWNQVYVDGEWKIVDVSSNGGEMYRNFYLLIDVDDENWDWLVMDENDKLELDLIKLTLKLNSF